MSADRPVAIVPLVGYRGGASLDSDLPGSPPSEADPAACFGIEVDVWTRPDAGLEVSADRQTLSFSGREGSAADAFDLTIDYFQVGGRYQPGTGSFRPYVAAALGLTHWGADGGNVSTSLGFSGSVGGGFDASLGQRVAFRGELRGYATAADTTISGTCGAGCSVQLHASGWYQLAARIGLVFRLK